MEAIDLDALFDTNMKGIENFIVEIASEFEDKIGSIYIPNAPHTRTHKGIVKALASRMHGPAETHGFAEDFAGEYDVMRPAQFTKKSGRAYIWFENAIQDEIKIGDEVEFFQAMNSKSNYLGDNLLAIRPSAIYAYNEIPYRGLIKIKQAVKPLSTILFGTEQEVPGQGEVVAVGQPLKGDTLEVKVGDKVAFIIRTHIKGRDGFLYVPNADLLGLV